MEFSVFGFCFFGFMCANQASNSVISAHNHTFIKECTKTATIGCVIIVIPCIYFYVNIILIVCWIFFHYFKWVYKKIACIFSRRDKLCYLEFQKYFLNYQKFRCKLLWSSSEGYLKRFLRLYYSFVLKKLWNWVKLVKGIFLALAGSLLGSSREVRMAL